MLRVGLTGGIGAGKSEVSHRLAALGAVVVDADRLAREVLEPGTPGFLAVVSEFGPAVVAPDGSLDRARLASLVFGDDDARGRLEAIVHPLVRARAAQVESAAVQADPHAVVVHDVPLLVETGQASAYDAVVVVDAADDVRVQRLLSARGMSEAEARARIAAQAGPEERLAAATYVLDNGAGLDALDTRVRALWQDLLAHERLPARPG